MWYLKSQHDGSLFYLLVGKTYTINRKEGDLVLANDQSISRKHSAILISHEGEVFLWDEGSKYGTFIYEGEVEQKLEPHQRTKIMIGDKFRFGLQWNIYLLCQMDFVVCTSSIALDEKKVLKSVLSKIGGRFSNDWNDHCTHLAMNKVSLTHKVVLALAAGKPITTVQYWQKMEEAISNQLALPKIEDFLSPVGEEELQRQSSRDTLLPSQNRKSLFQGKIFIFSSEDIKNRIRHLVECAGGICESVQTSKLQPKAYCDPKYIVVRYSEACKQQMPDVIAVLKRKGLRSIPISEIGLAIYYNSLTRYCNPSWRKPAILGDSPSQSQGVCLVENTEDIPSKTEKIKVEPLDDTVIPPSLTSVVSDTSIDSSRSIKRPLLTSPAENPPPKRSAQQKNTAKASGTLYQWLQRTGSSSAKESEATCSIDTSGDNLFDKLQNTQNNISAIPGDGSDEDSDLFKLPSPKKNVGTKRGRMEDDGFLLPQPKKVPNPDRTTKTSKLPSPIKVVNSDDKFEETLEDDSEDEFKMPSQMPRKKRQLRSEDADDSDEFDLRSSSKKNSRSVESDNGNAAKKRQLRSEDADDSDEFDLRPSSSKKNSRSVESDNGNAAKKRQLRSEDADDSDEFDLRPSSSTKNSRSVESDNGNAAKKTKTIQKGWQSTLSLEKTRKLDPTGQINQRRLASRMDNETVNSRPESRTETTTTSVELNGRQNTSHAPSLAEFLDKSVGIAVKKEEVSDDEINNDLAEIIIDIKEISLFREKPPLRDININTVHNGRPNFKIFKKSRQRTERILINLEVDHNASGYEGVPDPGAPMAPNRNGSSNREPESQNFEDIFSLTNGRSQPSRQKGPRHQESQVVDEWTVP